MQSWGEDNRCTCSVGQVQLQRGTSIDLDSRALPTQVLPAMIGTQHLINFPRFPFPYLQNREISSYHTTFGQPGKESGEKTQKRLKHLGDSRLIKGPGLRVLGKSFPASWPYNFIQEWLSRNLSLRDS